MRFVATNVCVATAICNLQFGQNSKEQQFFASASLISLDRLKH